MDQDKLIGQAVVAVPIIHVATCAIYLAGYSAGFGAHIGTLFGIADLFGLSVSELFWTYLAGVLIPVVAISPQLRPDYKTPYAKAYETGVPENIERVIWQDKLFRNVYVFTFTAFSLFLLFDVFISVMMDQKVPYIELSQPSAFFVSFAWTSYASKLTTKRSTDLVVAIIVTLSLIAFATGLSKGQAERRYPAKVFLDAYPSCESWVALRAVGDRMIALRKDDTHAIITKECKVALLIPKRKAFREENLVVLTTEWWTGREKKLSTITK